MKEKVGVFVLMGGKSTEHDVSIQTGIQIVKNFNNRKYKIIPLIISKKAGKWLLIDKQRLIKSSFINKSVVVGHYGGVQDIGVNKTKDVFFIALHGMFGEDGTVQGMLDLAGIKYTGSGVLASALGIDKLMFRKVMKAENIKVPRFVVIGKLADLNLKKIKKEIGDFPYFVKPHNQGSSIGTGIARSFSQLKDLIKEALKYSSEVLIDEYLSGREFTVSILGNNRPIPLPVIEIVPQKGKYFDYSSKYESGGADEIVPAKISSVLTKKIQTIAVDVYKAINCRGFARVDFILSREVPYVLEINTIPGMTETSLLPKAAKTAGVSFPKLLDKIISFALYEDKNK